MHRPVATARPSEPSAMHIQLSEIAGCAATGTVLPLDAVPRQHITLCGKLHETFVNDPAGTCQIQGGAKNRTRRQVRSGRVERVLGRR